MFAATKLADSTLVRFSMKARHMSPFMNGTDQTWRAKWRMFLTTFANNMEPMPPLSAGDSPLPANVRN